MTDQPKSRRLFTSTTGDSNNTTFKTYKTQAAAAKAIEKALQKIEAPDARWIMACHPNGRFHPVVLFCNHYSCQLMALPHMGFCIVS